MNNFTADISSLRTPCYVVDRGRLASNLTILKNVQDRTAAKILLALKGFAMWSVFDQVSGALAGASASALFEAKLAKELFGKELHLCAPAYRGDEIEVFTQICDHIVFNSFSQWQRFKPFIDDSNVSPGLRLNPQHRETSVEIYDPCAKYSRLGITEANFRPDMLDGIEGLHFHNLCELNSDSLARTLAAVEDKFGQYFHQMKWVNFGGGHHITRPDYDVDLLCELISDFQGKYDVQVYLEPGEAIAINTGFLICSVLDITYNEMPIAILDTSASAHMPDVLEMPYRPEIQGASTPNDKAHTYRLAGPTCLAGDVIGDYSFDHELKVGDKLIFCDMAHYTMVKNTMFNGIALPDIVTYNPSTQEFTVQRHFEYEDFKNRLS
ncbi:MAG: carboxynorspermidine decarboxylase [Phycisphaerae bacterium]|nr:carboxynorspermidine decarboxylase [Phycisphaerae bacterium]